MDPLSPPEVMIFFWSLPCLLSKILGSHPALGPVFMGEVNLRDTYMRVWLLPKYILDLYFVVPPAPG